MVTSINICLRLTVAFNVTLLAFSEEAVKCQFFFFFPSQVGDGGHLEFKIQCGKSQMKHNVYSNIKQCKNHAAYGNFHLFNRKRYDKK